MRPCDEDVAHAEVVGEGARDAGADDELRAVAHAQQVCRARRIAGALAGRRDDDVPVEAAPPERGALLGHGGQDDDARRG